MFKVDNEVWTLTVDVDFLQHRSQLLRPRKLSQGAHHSAEFFLRDSSVAVLVKQPEGLSEFCGEEIAWESDRRDAFAFFCFAGISKIDLPEFAGKIARLKYDVSSSPSFVGQVLFRHFPTIFS